MSTLLELSRRDLHWRWRTGLWLAWIVCFHPLVGRADNPLNELKTIRILPRTEAEVASAHERSRGQACEHVPAGEPLEISSFLPEFVDGRTSLDDLPVPTSRRAAFSVGLNMLDEDRADLPTLTGGRISSYLDEHYVCIEPRVQRDLASGELYLHHRPMAATATFHGARLTQEFTELVSDSVRDMRSLGLFVPSRKRSEPAQFRLLVVIHKSLMAALPGRGVKAGKPKPVYEFVFVRGRLSAENKDAFSLHAFATSQERRRLHYLRPFSHPQRPEQCGICGSIYFTDYKVANLLPVASAQRRTTVRSSASYAIGELDDYADKAGWHGGAWDNLTEILDAVIDRKVPPSLGPAEEVKR